MMKKITLKKEDIYTGQVDDDDIPNGLGEI